MLRTLLRSRAASLPLGARLASTAAAAPAATTTTASEPISVPTLRKLDARWERMPEDERDELISALAERQKVDWHQLTPYEKRAAWYIAYGEWGPRRPVHGKGDVGRIFYGTLIGVASAFAFFFGLRLLLPGHGKTMSKEWQEATNEELESINANPFTGYNQVQSPATGISAEDLEDDDDE